MIQAHSDKTDTTLKKNSTATYPVHIVLPNFIKDFQRFLIHHRHTIVGLFPVLAFVFLEETRDDDKAEGCGGINGETIIPLTIDLYQTARGHGSYEDKNISFCHGPRSRAFQGSLWENNYSTIKKQIVEVPSSGCTVLLNIPESKEMSGVKHGRTPLSFVRVLSTWDDVFAIKHGKRRLDINMEKV